jgi:hypothetical protein
VLTGIETRTSSPLRITRGEDAEPEREGLFPAGEGAGYAGGILSAGVDGIRIAEAVARDMLGLKPEQHPVGARSSQGIFERPQILARRTLAGKAHRAPHSPQRPRSTFQLIPLPLSHA